jgi:SPP1 family predicted phage head-tail adaptor
MPRYYVTKKKYPVVDAGSLNCRIVINLRQINAPTYSDVNFNETFTKRIDIWAMIETLKTGITIFDATNTERVITHRIYIRKPSFEITAENWVEYRGVYYYIHSVEEMGMENRFLCLLTNLRGDKTRIVNYA